MTKWGPSPVNPVQLKVYGWVPPDAVAEIEAVPPKHIMVSLLIDNTIGIPSGIVINVSA